MVDCRSTTARWQAAQCRLSSTMHERERPASTMYLGPGVTPAVRCPRQRVGKGVDPPFRPPPVELSAFIADFVNSMPSNFIPCLAYPLFSRKRPHQKPAQKYAHIFSFKVVDNPQSYCYIALCGESAILDPRTKVQDPSAEAPEAHRAPLLSSRLPKPGPWFSHARLEVFLPSLKFASPAPAFAPGLFSVKVRITLTRGRGDA